MLPSTTPKVWRDSGLFIGRHTGTAAGRNDLERASISRLLREARDEAWLTQDEYEKLERIRHARNPIAHFRAPLAEDSIEFRALGTEDHPYSVIKQDARDVIEAVMCMLGRNTA